MIRLSAFADEAAGDFEGQLRALERNRIPYIELRGLDGDNILDITEERAREYARRLEKAGKKVWALGSPVGKAKTEDFPRQEKNLLHLCRLARIFGTPRIRVFSFFEAYDKEETVIAHLSRLVELAAREGCTLYHENEKEIFGDTLVRVQRLMDRVPGLEFVYDPANFVQVGEKSENTLPALHSRCRYFHIKDALRETEEIVPAGLGDGNIPELVRRIDADRNVTLTLEPHLAVFDGYAGIDSTELKNRYRFSSNEEAFDAAVRALKNVLKEAGYREIEEGFVK